MCKIDTDAGIIVGGISNTNGSVVLGLNVCLHVTDCRLHESGSISVVDIVRDFVASKETKDVSVVGHGINDSGVIGIQFGGPCWGVSVD